MISNFYLLPLATWLASQGAVQVGKRVESNAFGHIHDRECADDDWLDRDQDPQGVLGI